MRLSMPGKHLFGNADIVRLPKALSDPLTPPHQADHWGKRQHASDKREYYKRQMEPNTVAELDAIEGHREAGLLPQDVEQLRDLRAFDPVAVDGVGVGRCGYDLQAEDADEHPKERTCPVRLVLHSEAKDQQACWNEDCTWPDTFEADLQRHGQRLRRV